MMYSFSHITKWWARWFMEFLDNYMKLFRIPHTNQTRRQLINVDSRLTLSPSSIRRYFKFSSNLPKIHIVHSLTHQSHHKYHPNTRYIFENSSLCQVEDASQSFHRAMIWWNDINVGRICKLHMTGFKLINMLQDWNGWPIWNKRFLIWTTTFNSCGFLSCHSLHPPSKGTAHQCGKYSQVTNTRIQANILVARMAWVAYVK